MNDKRTDSASLVINATPQKLYAAFVDPDALISWLPPEGMTGQVLAFDPRPGGEYRMALFYDRRNSAIEGKTTENSDVVQGRFLELVSDHKIVQEGDFDSDDPAFAGTMKMTWSLSPVEGGTNVTVICENVPIGIRKEDHDEGLKSTLQNLARFAQGSD